MANIGSLLCIVLTLVVILNPRALERATTASNANNAPQTAAALPSFEAPTEQATTSETGVQNSPTIVATTTPTKPNIPLNKAKKQGSPTTTSTADPNEVRRIPDPYSYGPLPFPTINVDTRSALVNILCQPQGGTIRPISASGVIIDPRGVVLTNAHVAQYVLLAQSSEIDLSCFIRTGAPAKARWGAQVLFLPPVWVDEHVHEINTQHALGTGEHDYGLLLINSSFDGAPLPFPFPFIQPDTREAIAFQSDSVLVASYPAEFIGGLAAQFNLFPVSSITAIQQLLTFGEKSVDLISVGGVIGAQSGSSGGAVVNAWDRLVGIIVTTSEGPTTGERDLRALTLSYIDRDIKIQSGIDLSTILSANVSEVAYEFTRATAPGLLKKYLETILKGRAQ